VSRFCDIENSEKGGTCVLVCNGPSLNKMKLKFLADFTSIGLNKIFLGFEKFNFTPKYYIAVNPKVISQSASEIGKMSSIKFIGSGGHHLVDEDSSTYHINTAGRLPRFSTDLRLGAHEGWTVTHVALQVAYFLGFKTVIIIGMDHRYSFNGAPNQSLRMNGPDVNHFCTSYFSELDWDCPDLARSEQSYKVARSFFENDGRNIIDATLEGNCDVFEKADYREVFGV